MAAKASNSRTTNVDPWSGVAASARYHQPQRKLLPANHESRVTNHDTASRRLWLALYLPRFPLEVLAPEHDDVLCVAVISAEGTRAVIVAAGTRVEAAGVFPGMPASAACALVPKLALISRDPVAEAAALEGLAAWSGQFTSLVSLVPPQGLLLEVGGSLALFGGLDALLARVRHGIDALGYSARFGVAPTPLAAWLLARAGFEEPVTSMERLAGRLARVPLACLDLPERILESLRNVGVEGFGDCCRLPRADTARRTDPKLIEYLDRALGKRADPRLPYTPPSAFERRLTLPCEMKDVEALLLAARRLLLELAGFLLARAAGVQKLELHLAHQRSPATRLVIELVTPSRDAHHLLLLVRERLARMEISEAVVYLGIRVCGLLPLALSSRDLFGEERAPGGDWQGLVERMRSRLGRAAVQGLTLSAEHRPEKAWRCCAPGQGGAVLDYPERPLWLLDPPRPIETMAGIPWLDGRLHLSHGPERIESGWWDGHDIARDYFVADHPRGARYWVYRELRQRRAWYLHGVFA